MPLNKEMIKQFYLNVTSTTTLGRIGDNSNEEVPHVPQRLIDFNGMPIHIGLFSV